MQDLVQAADVKPRIPSKDGQNTVPRGRDIPAIGLARATSLRRRPAGRHCRSRQASVADATVGRTGPTRRGQPQMSGTTSHPYLWGTDGRIGLAFHVSGEHRWRRISLALVVALFTGAVMIGAPRAWADSANSDPLVDVPPPPLVEVSVPSSPPATATSTDGWTMTLSANSETQTPVPSIDPAVPSHDYLVGGVFNATLRAPKPETAPTPSGTLEVGYQIQCVGGGLLAALKPGVVKVQVLKHEFKGADPAAVVTAFRVQVDCLSHAMIRSYAILTRGSNATDAVVAYYGVSMPTEE